MCLSVRAGTGCRVAEEPITVYKVIGRDNVSASYAFQYVPNTTYRIDASKFKAEKVGNVEFVNEGFHSFAALEDAREYLITLRYEKVVAFTIPKGAHYYVGTRGDLVSDSISAGDLEGV